MKKLLTKFLVLAVVVFMSVFLIAPAMVHADESKIVFASNRDGNYKIYIMNADGSGQANLTNNSTYYFDTCFSPAPAVATAQPLTRTPISEGKVLLNLSLGQQADLYGRTTTRLVKTLYVNILGRAADDGGLNDWVTTLNNGTMEPKDIVYNLVFSTELKQKISSMSPEEFVTFLCKNVFNREPDPSGYANWVNNMKNGMSKEDALINIIINIIKNIIKNIINSYEFKNIFKTFRLEITTKTVELNIADKVIELATDQIGKTKGDGPFTGMIWADSNYTYCDRFVSAVAAIALSKNLSERKAYPTAYDDYLAQSNLKSGNPPKGAIVYFGKHEENAYYEKDNQGNIVKKYGGHVGISDGNGNIISVVNKSSGVLSRPLKKFKAPLIGWVTPEERK